MRNPLDVEQRFQNLLFSLSCPEIPLQHLLQIASFLDYLGNDAVQYESYVIECMERLPQLVRQIIPAGSPPETLRLVYSRCASLTRTLPALHAVIGLDDALADLRVATGLLFAYAGAAEDLFSLLNENSEETPAWILEILRGGSNDRLSLLKNIAGEARARNEPAARELDLIVHRWPGAMSEIVEGVFVPVVERPIMTPVEQVDTGTLRNIRVKILGESDEGKDELSSTVSVFGVDRAAKDMTDVPVSAARSLLNDQYSFLRDRYFFGQLNFDTPLALHQGDSANLAIASLFFSGILRFSNQRVQRRIVSLVAMTGNISPTGSVLPVDDRTLALKIQAAFFSHVDTLVVPHAQEEKARQCSRELNLRYPRRTLDVVGVDHLREVFYDLRVFDLQRVPYPVHLARKLWQKKFRAGAITLIGVLTFILMKQNYGPVDKNPAALDFQGETIVVKNLGGEFLDSIWVGRQTVDEQRTSARLNAGYRMATFADVDNDGRNEILYIHKSATSGEDVDVLYCAKVQPHRVLWTLPVQRRLIFPDKADDLNDKFNSKCIDAFDCDGDGRIEVFILASHLTSFPSIVLSIDGATGKERSCYVHAGHLSGLWTVDLDGDGKKELLSCGVNNAFRMACLIVLDSRSVSGLSPVQGEYRNDSLGRGTEKWYVLIPRTVVGLHYRSIQKNNGASNIILQTSARKFAVEVLDVAIEGQNHHPITATMNYDFGFDLVASGISTGDDFDLLWEDLQHKGDIPEVALSAYLKTYGTTIRYWDGVAWETRPAMNRWCTTGAQQPGAQLQQAWNSNAKSP